VSLQSPDPVSVAPKETLTVPLTIAGGSAPFGAYEGILLEVAVDDGRTVYSNLRVNVTEPEAPELPDLALTCSDLSVVGDEGGATVTLQALVHNRGVVPASNVEVAFYEFGTLLGTTVIEEMAAEGTASVSIAIPMTIAGDHLFRVVVDPQGTIAEGDETNNEASLVAQWNTPPTMEGHILVTGSLPSSVYTGSLFAVAGQAVYELYIDGEPNTDYVVKGGSVEVTIKADDGTEWVYGGIHTDVNGNFRKYLVAPTSPGIYRILMRRSLERASWW
jgi:hypothetical protein